MNQEIYEKLREMRLSVMAKEYKEQSQSIDTPKLTFDQRFESMVLKE